MTVDHTIQAVYTNTPTYHSLTICAEGAFNHLPAIGAGIYVDGNYVGSGYATLQVTQGSHQIAFDTYYRGVPFWHFHDFHDGTFDDGYNNYYVYFNSDHTIVGLYYA